MLEGFLNAVAPWSLAVEIIGVIIGIIFGAIPGLTATLGIALFVPVTFLMSPEHGMIMLGGIYAGGIFGGSISAILLNVPGTPASIVTGWEGHALARQGKAPFALGLAALSSGVGGVISAIAVLFLTPVLSRLALTFGSPEYCALLIFSFTIVIVMLETPLVGNLFGCVVGLLIVTIGLDPVVGTPRFTFGVTDLMSGFNMVAVLIGFFCMTQAVVLALDSLRGDPAGPVSFEGSSDHGVLVRTLGNRIGTYLRSSVLGVFLGILPALGPVETPFIAHAVERRFNRRGEKFGEGSISGLIASEASISANVGGSLIPLISLGIPGSGAAAVFIGSLTLHGLQPGPMLFVNQTALVYTFFWGFLILNLFMLFFGLFGVRYCAAVLKVPKSVIATFVAVFSLLGSYSIENSLFDVFVMLGATVFALWFQALRISILPVVMAIILGPLFEQQAVVLATSYSSVIDVLARPITDGFLLVSIGMVAFRLLRRKPPLEVDETVPAHG
ncbi:tripartite tricarboxylate transporter permease [Rhizobium halophytocola]|uniref:Tricarboxylic transport membrane protein n=1 Tax=Rhizobium halophytocola TaxID=735519 RepID=A0ABS4DU86_9HYPH|nr:tripartite tricarboxylate transporter permease [Rhizobium halophytocola]MBP1849266.1 putative tricarboxylic transport membrane protein [Rhizobium halophytocola]